MGFVTTHSIQSCHVGASPRPPGRNYFVYNAGTGAFYAGAVVLGYAPALQLARDRGGATAYTLKSDARNVQRRLARRQRGWIVVGASP